MCGLPIFFEIKSNRPCNWEWMVKASKIRKNFKMSAFAIDFGQFECAESEFECC